MDGAQDCAATSGMAIDHQQKEGDERLGQDASEKEASQEQENGAEPDKNETESSAPQETDNVQKSDEAATDDAQKKDEDQETHDDPKKTKRRQSMRALVMAAPEAIEDAKASLAKCDVLIEEAKSREAAAQQVVEEANQAVLACGEEVKEMCRVEAECIEQMASFQKRKREAAKNTAQKRAELQSKQDLLVLLEMEQARVVLEREKQASQESEQAAKRQKIDELQRVLDDAKKAHDEMKERERQARAEMRLLMKDTKAGASTALGAFGRRQRASQKAKAASPQKGKTGDALPADVANPDAVDASAAGVVKVKMEVMQAFGAPRSRELPADPILIEDSQ
eukprot:TRINITY_DN3278_c0_g2_i2.p1 TRINITY_DN3278_c0_g2~~TRINITY_DN3278_c0_g2_i2.p1  ORF type:complete len:390 (+),score=139.75 TRINITY_DN3278_c0_g2_i2:159-1172(+)